MITTTHDNPDGDGAEPLWFVVEAESRLGFLGGTELLAITHLREAGFVTFWPHFRATIRLGRSRNWKDRRPITVLRGYYPPWLFAHKMGDPTEAVARIKDTRYIADVLWAEHDRHYIHPDWLRWLVSNKPHPTLRAEVIVIDKDGEDGPTRRVEDAGPLMPPTCIDPAAGLFEPPDQTAAKARAASLRPGDRVRTLGKWATFEEAIGCRSVVKAVNDDGTVEVSHVQLFGADATAVYEPEQVERA